MKNIVKVTIQSSSGYCPAEFAYTDKLCITDTSISYEKTPRFESSAIRKTKWVYKIASKEFSDSFKKICDSMAITLYKDVENCTDVGYIKFTVLYDDGIKESTTYWCPGDEFKDTFEIIKSMLKGISELPECIKTKEDYD